MIQCIMIGGSREGDLYDRVSLARWEDIDGIEYSYFPVPDRETGKYYPMMFMGKTNLDVKGIIELAKSKGVQPINHPE